jgi:hypothetical protein
MNEGPQPARLDRGLHHENHQAYIRAVHLQALGEGFCVAIDRRVADRSGKTIAGIRRVIKERLASFTA